MNRFRLRRRPLSLAMAPLLISLFDDPTPPGDTNGGGSDNAGDAAGGGGDSGSGDAGGGEGGAGGNGGGSDDGAGTGGSGDGGEGKEGDAGDGNKPDEPDPNAPDPDDPANLVPENYAEVQVPEGLVFDAALATSLTPVLKAANVTQGQFAQMAEIVSEHQMRTWEATRQSWVDSANSDAELNANGGELKELARAAFGKFGNADAREVMVNMGWGDHPEMLRFIGKLAKQAGVMEDRGTDSASSGGGARSIEQRMYPGMKTKQ